jgi:hypothetical protein
MDTTTLILAVLTGTLAAVCLHAWRLGNEKRDVALLAAVSGLLGIGALASALA